MYIVSFLPAAKPTGQGTLSGLVVVGGENKYWKNLKKPLNIIRSWRNFRDIVPGPKAADTKIFRVATQFSGLPFFVTFERRRINPSIFLWQTPQVNKGLIPENQGCHLTFRVAIFVHFGPKQAYNGHELLWGHTKVICWFFWVWPGVTRRDQLFWMKNHAI